MKTMINSSAADCCRSLPAAPVALFSSVPALVAVVVGVLCLPTAAQEQRSDGLESIRADDLRQHATTLADDAFGGRYTASPGQRKAAEYIAAHYRKLGLEPFGDLVDSETDPTKDGDRARGFFFDVPLARTAIAPDASIRIGDDKHVSGFALFPNESGQGVDVEGQFVYAGTGSRGELPRAGARGETPLVGKIPLIVRTIPDVGNQPTEVVAGRMMQEMFRIGGAARTLQRLGAEALVIALPNDGNAIAGFMNYIGLTPEKPSLSYGHGQDQLGMLSQGLRGPIPVVFLDGERSQAVLSQLGVGLNEDGSAPKRRDAGTDPYGVDGGVTVKTVRDEVVAPNVVAVLPGSDPELAKEVVVCSAHMDHMGVRMDGDAYNGADDNASGTSGLLELAEALVATGQRPKRSIMFLSVCAEELGLWGSKHFAENPTWPLADVVANVNIDMIGRITDLSAKEEISATPSHRHPRYSSIGATAAKNAALEGLSLTIGDQFYERSDHYNFAERGIPVIFFCDGEHEDYHQVTDTPDKLDYDRMAAVVRLAYRTVVEVADAAARPVELGRQKDWIEAESTTGR